MHEGTVSFGEKLHTIYVSFNHDQNSPCTNLKVPYRIPVKHVSNQIQAIARAQYFEIYCKKCGAKYFPPDK